MSTIILDAGHGGHDPGAVGKNSKEKDNVLKVVKEVDKILTSKGHKVIYTRTTDVFVTLSERAAIANRANADLFISFHDNAAVSTATGFETFIYNRTTNAKSKQLQNAVHDAIIKVIGIRNRGKKSANFAVLRETKMAAVLIEYAFITNISDEKILINEVTKLANATAQGILNVAGGGTVSKPIPGKPTAKPKPTPAKQPTKGYQGTSIVDYLKYNKINSSFDSRAALAKKHGINGYAGTQSQNDRLLKALRGGKVSTPKPKPTAKPSLKVDGKVKIKSSAVKYSRTNVTIPNRFKNKSYTIQQVSKNDVLIKELYSWVKITDLQ